jgi:hypothetical protein
METMPSNLEKQVDEEYTRIKALDSKLGESRTPYLKWQLRLAQHILDDTRSYLRSVKGDTNNSYWIMFATDCLARANEKRTIVEDTVNKYGGPENVVEEPR